MDPLSPSSSFLYYREDAMGFFEQSITSSSNYRDWLGFEEGTDWRGCAKVCYFFNCICGWRKLVEA